MTFKPGPIDASELYHTRTVVLMETGPGTNVYQQLAFTKMEFEELEELIAGCVVEAPNGRPILRMKRDEMQLISEIKDYYDEAH